MNIYTEILKNKLDEIFNTKGEKYIISEKINMDNYIDGIYEIIWDKYYRYDNFIPTVKELKRISNLNEYKVENGKYLIMNKSYYPSEFIEINKEEIRQKKLDKILK